MMTCMTPSSTEQSARGRTSVANVGEIFADARELSCRHAHDGAVLRVRDAEVLAVDVHELELKVRDAVILCRRRRRHGLGDAAMWSTHAKVHWRVMLVDQRCRMFA
jgi:hypothetical protein